LSRGFWEKEQRARRKEQRGKKQEKTTLLPFCQAVFSAETTGAVLMADTWSQGIITAIIV
jgi:hypothetical protein